VEQGSELAGVISGHMEPIIDALKRRTWASSWLKASTLNWNQTKLSHPFGRLLE